MLLFLMLWMIIGILVNFYLEYEIYKENIAYEFTLSTLLLILSVDAILRPWYMIEDILATIGCFIMQKTHSWYNIFDRFDKIILFKRYS